MTGHDDEGALLDGQRDLGGLGGAKRAGVGGIEHAHAGDVYLADLQREGQQLVEGVLLGQRGKRLEEEVVDGLVGGAQHACVVRVGGDAADAEEDEALQGADVLVLVPHGGHVVVLDDLDAGCIGNRLGFLVHEPGELVNGLLVEVDVGDAGEQAIDDELLGVVGDAAGRTRGACQADHRPGQLVLGECDVAGLAANAGLAGAGLAACGLLALEAEHGVVRHGSLFLSCARYRQ